MSVIWKKHGIRRKKKLWPEEASAGDPAVVEEDSAGDPPVVEEAWNKQGQRKCPFFSLFLRVTTRHASRDGSLLRNCLHALLSFQQSACQIVRYWVSCVVRRWFAVPLACRCSSNARVSDILLSSLCIVFMALQNASFPFLPYSLSIYFLHFLDSLISPEVSCIV